MNFVPLLDLYNAIAPQAPGLNEVSALDELRTAARALAHASKVSQESITTAVAAGGAFLAIDTPDSAVDAVGVMWIEYGKTRLHPINPMDLAERDPAWRSRVPGRPQWYTQETADEVTLIPAAKDAEANVIMRIAYQPARGATKIDEVLVRHYEEALIDGALYRILRMPNCAWSNPAAAQQHQERYEMAISRARADGRRNMMLNTPLQTTVRCLA